MLKVEKPSDLLQHVGETLGPSEWLTVTQDMIDKFGDATGDHCKHRKHWPADIGQPDA